MQPTLPASPPFAAERANPAGIALLACLALALPTALAFNLPPSSTFLNQAAALVAWGAWLIVLTSLPARGAAASMRGLPRGLLALQAALALVGLAALAAPLWAALPWSLARAGFGRAAFRAFCIGMVAAGALSSIVGIVQVFVPTLADGNLIARSYIEGRAVGNMRQPNHLSSLLLWAIVAAVWLGEARVLRRAASALLALLFTFVVVLSASRTGALSMLLLAAWGLVDRRLSRWSRLLLIATPLVYALLWYATGVWADHSHHVFGGETRFSTKGDISSSRWSIWSNTLALIRMHPWAGVGFGEFNFAWTLTPFPGRPLAFFDHTHNLVLQFLVELGIPLGALVLGLLLAALWAAFSAARRPVARDAEVGDALLRPAAFMMVLLILVHSLLEYPLWYAYFLLPAAFAFGLCLVETNETPPRRASEPPRRGAGESPPVDAAVAPSFDRAGAARLRPLVVASLVLTMGGLAAVLDYARVAVIFAPPEGAAPLAQRIVDGRRSVFFSHHADYAAATTTEHPAEVMPAFLGAPHYLLDARLLQAWATALDEAGDTEHARHVAQRLREFDNAQSAEFFAPCAAPALQGATLPFQCQAPSRAFRYEDFR